MNRNDENLISNSMRPLVSERRRAFSDITNKISLNRIANQVIKPLVSKTLVTAKAPLTTIPPPQPQKVKDPVVYEEPCHVSAMDISGCSIKEELACSISAIDITDSPFQNEDSKPLQPDREPIAEMTEFDKQNMKDPQFVSEYAAHIHEYMRSAETKYVAKKDYMTSQPDITPMMRAILIDWLIEVHNTFGLLSETLFLTVNLVDRFLEQKNISRSKLQLVGISALLIASKYEEVSFPSIDEFVDICANSYEKKDILAMELLILSTLDFNITVCSVAAFLKRYLRCGGSSVKAGCMSYMLAEMSLLDVEMLKFEPSVIASSCIYLSNNILSLPHMWGRTMVEYTGYSEDDISECTNSLLSVAKHQSVEFLKPSERRKFQAVMTKYSSSHYAKVATILSGQCNN